MATTVIALLFLSLVVAVDPNRNSSNSTMSLFKCLNCSDIFDSCKKLNSIDDNCEKIWHTCLSNNQTESANESKTCEKIADIITLLSNHCPHVITTPTTDLHITPTTTSSQCDTATIQHTTTITASDCPSTCSVKQTICIPTQTTVTDISSQPACTYMSTAVNGIQFMAFDKAIVGLLGLSLLLLVVVTTAWVCTCLITKKRKRMMEVTTDDTTDFAEKYFENPTYDGTSMIRIHSKPSQGVNRVPVLPIAVRQHQQASSQAAFSGAGTTTYDAVNTASPKAAGNGQTYDVLDRGKSNCTARKSARAPKGYSQLGVPDKDVVDSRYHLISKEND